jgi:DNA-binding response OmpR family regulator
VERLFASGYSRPISGRKNCEERQVAGPIIPGPVRVLSLLLERPGEIVTRDEIVRELWGSDTFVDSDQSIGAVIRKLWRARAIRPNRRDAL